MRGLSAATCTVWRYQEVAGKSSSAKVGPQLVPQIQAIFSDPQQLICLKLKFDITINLGEHFVKATYFLEGDSPLVFSCHEKLGAVLPKFAKLPISLTLELVNEELRPLTQQFNGL